MIADCWRPSGYFSICFFAQAVFSAVKENSFGCSSGGARRRTATLSLQSCGSGKLADEGHNHVPVDAAAIAIVGHTDQQVLPALRDQQGHSAGFDVRMDDSVPAVEQCTERLLVGSGAGRRIDTGNDLHAGTDFLHEDAGIAVLNRLLAHRSTSPNTISRLPRIADTSASMWPRQRKSIAERCAKPGGRILHL